MIPTVIIDFHTHIFPPAIAGDRDAYVRADGAFGALYSEPKASLASADDLLASMDRAGIDVSVALGFAWTEAETCRLHNDYLIEASGRSRGRIVPFCTLPLAAGDAAIEAEARRCSAAGVRGFGELRPDNLGFDLGSSGGAWLARLALELDVALTFHVSEPVGHGYAGKSGLSLDAFYGFVCAYPAVKAIGAHWAGGLPFFAAMPEVRQALGHVSVDTAASSLLYDESIYGAVAGLVGAGRILFGSDFPLLSQARARRRIDEAALDTQARELILGGNAKALLGLT